MANYYGSARSNYFKVKDIEKFEKEFLQVFGPMSLIKDTDGRVGFLVDSEEGGIPSVAYDDNFEELDLDFDQELAKHLVDGEVAVYQEVGAEKLRYLVGYSVAVNSNFDVIRISIDDIYGIAKDRFNAKNITNATY